MRPPINDRPPPSFVGKPKCSVVIVSTYGTRYDQLSPGLQEMLEGMTAIHGVQDLMSQYGEGADLRSYPNGPGLETRIENEHPCVIVHPVTKRKSLYVNNWPCKRFTGMTQADTKPLKQMLVKGAVKPENVYRHHWCVRRSTKLPPASPPAFERRLVTIPRATPAPRLAAGPSATSS